MVAEEVIRTLILWFMPLESLTCDMVHCLSVTAFSISLNVAIISWLRSLKGSIVLHSTRHNCFPLFIRWKFDYYVRLKKQSHNLTSRRNCLWLLWIVLKSHQRLWIGANIVLDFTYRVTNSWLNTLPTLFLSNCLAHGFVTHRCLYKILRPRAVHRPIPTVSPISLTSRVC